MGLSLQDAVMRQLQKGNRLRAGSARQACKASPPEAVSYPFRDQAPQQDRGR